MQGNEIRTKFLEFFKSQGHEVVPSDRLVPKGDPSLLFTSAGMNQFKDQFMGKNITYKRAASCQKCLRTGDLANVGRTSGHHTFFEMLGNFSFGDYFKKEACTWAWEFMTGVLRLDREKLWVSVYEEDDEAYSIWREAIGVPEERIVKFGAKDNFWPSNAPIDGPNGPCGPCSEIFYDWGEKTGCGKQDCNPACDCGRFIEVWNLVFTQFNRVDVNKLEPLPSKNIDTGMGLERLTAVIQGVKTNFETDLFTPIIDEIRGYNKKLSISVLNAIADHLRAVAFAICDGISPSNEERGYVVRKLIRKAYLLGKANKPFLYNIIPRIAKIMEGPYPMLKKRREDITSVIKEEEEKFQNTLLTAMPKLEDSIAEFRKKRVIPGSEIFKLVDTYGLPLEVIEERVRQAKYKLDREGFETLMKKRKEMSREKSKIEDDIFVDEVFSKSPNPEFSDSDPLNAEIMFMVKNKIKINKAKKGDIIALLTNPQSAVFYTESGGQVGDTGLIEKDGTRADILNTRKIDGRLIHECRVESGTLKINDKVLIKLDRIRNKDIAKNHTATHLLHSALRKILGEHVRQYGSLVVNNRLRFDFTHMKKMSEIEIERVEDFVNDRINGSIKVKKEVKTKSEAESEGAIALFGEKYADKVRVVSIRDCSKELCGGTHVDNTNEIGVFKIISESSIASGVRRIEAVTDTSVGVWLKEDISRLLSLYYAEREALKDNDEARLKNKELETAIGKSEDLKNGKYPCTWDSVKSYTYTVRPTVVNALEYFAKVKKKIQKKQTELDIKDIGEKLDKILKNSQQHKGVQIIIADIGTVNMNALRRTADMIKKNAKSAFIALASIFNERVNLVITFTDDIGKKGLNASDIIKESASIVNGSGGGRKDFAQAGGSDITKVKDALEAAKRLFQNQF